MQRIARLSSYPLRVGHILIRCSSTSQRIMAPLGAPLTYPEPISDEQLYFYGRPGKGLVEWVKISNEWYEQEYDWNLIRGILRQATYDEMYDRLGISTAMLNYMLLGGLHFWLINPRLTTHPKFPRKRRGELLKLLMEEFEETLEKEGVHAMVMRKTIAGAQGMLLGMFEDLDRR
jgi:hypothetical protein